MRGRCPPIRRSNAGVGLGFVIPSIAAMWTFALHRMFLWAIVEPGRLVSHPGEVEPFNHLVGVWAVAVAIYVTLRALRRVGSGPQPALALAAFALTGLEAAALARWTLDVPSIPSGAAGAGHFRSLFHLVTTTASLAYGLGMGLACVVGVVDVVRIRRGQGWAVDDA